MTLLVGRHGSRPIRSSAPPLLGSTPLRIEPSPGGWLLLQFDFRHDAKQRQTLLGVYGSEKEAEAAVALLVDRGRKAPPHGKGGGSARAKQKLLQTTFGRK